MSIIKAICNMPLVELKSGISAGISSDVTYFAASKMKRRHPDKNVVTVFANSMNGYI